MIGATKERWSRWSTGWDRRLLLATLSSLLLHAILIATIDYRDERPPHQTKKAPQMMDVVLFKQPQKRSSKKSHHAKTIANQSINGAAKPLKDSIDRMARAPVIAPRPTAPRPPVPTPAPRIPPLPAPRPKRERHNRADPPPVIHHQAVKRQSSPIQQTRRAQRPQPTLRPIPLTRLMASALPFAQQSRHQERALSRDTPRREANIPINTREVK
ncbi:MAG: hypothetical protein Q9M13_04825, partial [Mariprofundales bacterium]|nr:hypothetical protein [Mariprofundales bacterium]